MRSTPLKLVLGLVLLYALAAIGRIYARKYYIWMPDYVTRTMAPNEPVHGPVHILFYFTDHFEPRRGGGLMRLWEKEYPVRAARHRDATGRPVQHTWFYPGEIAEDSQLEALRRLTMAGYGEVELHYHHWNDTYATARAKFAAAITHFQRFGFLRTIHGETRFAFAHGNSGLDNSLPEWCGVNRELALLRDLGCFADYTFPSLWTNAQPSIVNTIYEAEESDADKSYDRGVLVRVNRPACARSLFIMQGPLAIIPNWNPLQLFWSVEDGNITTGMPLTPRRVDAWVRANVHVEGRPEWVFVKVHAHGAADASAARRAMGEAFEQVLHHLETNYNDGRRYVLHYVTAREAYNIAVAAAAGRTGDPTQYLDWEIAPYEAGGTPHPKAPEWMVGSPPVSPTAGGEGDTGHAREWQPVGRIIAGADDCLPASPPDQK